MRSFALRFQNCFLGRRLVAAALCGGIIFPVAIVVSAAASKRETILWAVIDKAKPGDVPVIKKISVSNEPHEIYTAPPGVGELRGSVTFSEDLRVRQALKFPRIAIRHDKDARWQLASLGIIRIKRIWW